jgi:alpha-tubulin suppressor-like RCC1 family protein
LSGITALAAGDLFTCALTSGGGVECWGDNTYGQLGNGSTTNSATPVQVTGLSSGVVAISAGGFVGDGFACALMTSGGVKCWGANIWGELGASSTSTCATSYSCSLTPVQVTGLTTGVTAISAGGATACAITTGGAVKCWGYGSDGELGNGTTPNTDYAPVPVTGLTSGVIAISSGDETSCAIVTGGEVWCWGDNVNLELGNDSTATNSAVPVQVTGF